VKKTPPVVENYNRRYCYVETIYKSGNAKRRSVSKKGSGRIKPTNCRKHGLTKNKIKQLVSRQNRKARLIANGYTPLPKGRPRKNTADEKTRSDDLAK
jgi:hypothetical protein